MDKPIIGISGGIGAGKSAVAQAFARLGASVVDSDRLNHEVLAQAGVIEQVEATLGTGVRDAAGGLDRRRLAERVFGDAAARGKVEAITYPLIAQRRADMIQQALEDPAVAAIVLDSPLLFENNIDRLCDAVVFVEASMATRLARLRDSRGWDEHELLRRERLQMPLSQKRIRSQYVIDNESASQDLHEQAAKIFDEIVSRHRSRS